MQVSWTFPERLGALLLCKGFQHGSIKQWGIVKAGEKVLKLEEKEVDSYQKKQDSKTEKKYELDEQFVKLLREKCKELDAKNMIPSALLPLAEKLVSE